MKKRLLWQIYPAFLVITLLSLFAISWNVKGLIRNSFLNENRLFLEHIARLSLPPFIDALEENDLAEIQNLCRQMAAVAQTRFTLIDPQGKVLGESDKSPEKMVNHFDRPEFQQALGGGIGSRIRPSDTLGQEMMYVAVPITHDGDVVAVLRTSVAMTQLQATQQSIFRKIVQYGVMIAIVLAVISLGLSWKITRPLVRLRRGAEQFAKGDLTHRLPVLHASEIGDLAISMNEMAVQLDERIRDLVAQKNEQQAVLASMIEGVIAVDTQGHILSLNNAAADILQTNKQDAVGRTVEEIFRNTELQQFVQQAAEGDESMEKQVVLHEKSQNEQFLQVHGTALQDDKQSKIGVLIVLNDITHIRKLERVRRDFVANVSHELKTPVTSIKGFIETLLDGAIHKPEDAERFLRIIARQTNRLNSIIDDLLALSRIEEQSQHEPVELESIAIKPILGAAVSICRSLADDKNISIEIDCADTLKARASSSLLEQAIVNLVDNAIKYSNPDNKILLEAAQNESETLIHIHDQGCGIAQEHLSRLFERFYRVDKARSRTLGGTGLGLAIVKHIAQFHKGSVTVESVVDKGSTFTLHLPTEGQSC